MVGLKRIFRRLMHVSLFAMSALAGSFSYALDLNTDLPIKCLLGYKACCVDGVMTCVDENDSTYKICLTSCASSDVELLEDCTTKGEIQYKPNGDCGTASRTCCGLTWSGWDKECPKTCDDTKPITSQSCGTNGTQTRSVTCDTATGEWTKGSWSACVEKVCTPGEVEPCPTNCYQRRTCNSAGTAWSSCACENQDEIWRITITYQNVTQSSNTCEAHCCCEGETPVSNMYNKYLNKNVGTGCLGTNGSAEYYCACKERDSGNQTGYTGTQTQCLR